MKPLLLPVGVLLLLSAGVLVWQNKLAISRPKLQEKEELSASAGACMYQSERFFYFFYYLGVVPVTAAFAPFEFSKAGAQRLVSVYGQHLRNDLNSPCAVGRLGDFGKFFLMLPHAWLKGSAEHPSMIPSTRILFSVALLSILLAGFFGGAIALALATILFVGSNHFQISHAYFQNNVFSIPISTCLILLAIHWKFLKGETPESALDWPRAIWSGILIALAAAVRLEALPLAGSVIFVFAFSSQAVKRRVLLCFVFLVSLYATSAVWEAKMRSDNAKAIQFVRSAGGFAYEGDWDTRHSVWHPMAAGLSDFGADKGYRWSDYELYQQQRETVEKALGLSLSIDVFYYRFKGESVYYLKPEVVPAYGQSLRRRILRDIFEEPLWWLKILVKRAQRIWERSVPARIDLGPLQAQLPVGLVFVFLTVVGLWFSSRLYLLKAVVFVLPLSAVALFIYSGHGTTAYAIWPSIILAVFFEMIFGVMDDAYAKFRGRVGKRRVVRPRLFSGKST